jgi:hypothetical protein
VQTLHEWFSAAWPLLLGLAVLVGLGAIVVQAVTWALTHSD